MKPKLFADDINLFISGIDKTELNIKCSNFLAALHRWFVANYLYMNFDKTNVMVFPSAKQANISVKLNGTPITKVTNCRYLGLYIDSNLNWTYHIDYIYNKLLKFVGIFYKLRNKLPSVILRAIYFAFVHPHLLYGIELYANTGSTHLSKLETLNNRLLRIYFKVNHITFQAMSFMLNIILYQYQICMCYNFCCWFINLCIINIVCHVFLQITLNYSWM